MSLMARRSETIERTLGEVRRIERELGVSRAALDALKPVLIELAAKTELFPPEHFPVASGNTGRVYRLAEDADGRFALYASAGVPGKAQPPHNHTTWAVIAGVFGDEHNVFYERTDNRDEPGIGRIRKTGELTVQRGNACAFLPNDFHTIEVAGGKPSLHLHLYGMSLENLPERIHFSSSDGGRYTVFAAPPNIACPLVPAEELKAMLGDSEELAILDVREEGVFAEGHLFAAASLPLSRLELKLDALVPRRATRIVLCDDGDGLVNRAALRLMRLGYRNLAVLAGGVKAWAAAGQELFSGIYVPSKAFGEVVEHEAKTPHLSAGEVKALMDKGTDMIVLDSRPMDEFRKMSIPGGIDCPGAELVYRFYDTVPSPDTLVVVNCAGRTRSIIGAQSLINAGVPNPVVALKDGTMGWHLAGLDLAHGETRHAPPPSADGLARARAAAARLAGRCGASVIGANELAAFRHDQSRTLYLFDVRSPEEYRAGHRPGARSAPGGQLVQATDAYMATRNGRVVLCDSDGVRARMTASWLTQMGLPEIYVLDDGSERSELGPEPMRVLGLPEGIATIGAAALAPLVKDGAIVVVDLATSLDYRAAHIPGAWFAIRARFATALPRLPKDGAVVLTSPDGVLARLAAPDLAALAERAVTVLEGGTAAWRAAGLPLASGAERMADEPVDVWHRPYDRSTGIEEAMAAYLGWEVNLLRQIEREAAARFRTLTSV